MEIRITIQPTLFEELREALAECMRYENQATRGAIDLSDFAGEIIESFCASRRLPKVIVDRMRRTETAVDPRPRFAEHRDSGPLAPENIPDLGDLEVLAGLKG